MIKIANGQFSDNEKLYKLATECLSDTFKNYISDFLFLRHSKNIPTDELYTKVDIDEVMFLLPGKLIIELQKSEIDEELFLKKKIAELLTLLNSNEEVIPDVFSEYLLYRIIRTAEDDVFYEASELPNEYASKLKDLLNDYATEMVQDLFCVYEDDNGNTVYENEYGKELSKDEYESSLKSMINEYVNSTIINLTDLSKMSIDDDSLVFWDWDFMFIDDWGFENALKQLNGGIVSTMGGYANDTATNIFTSIGMDKPKFLDNAQQFDPSSINLFPFFN